MSTKSRIRHLRLAHVYSGQASIFRGGRRKYMRTTYLVYPPDFCWMDNPKGTNFRCWHYRTKRKAVGKALALGPGAVIRKEIVIRGRLLISPTYYTAYHTADEWEVW